MRVSLRVTFGPGPGTVLAAGAEGISSCLEAEVGGCNEEGSTDEHPQLGGRQGRGSKEKSQLKTPRLTAHSTACLVKPFLFPLTSPDWL